MVGLAPTSELYVACRDRFDDDTTIEDAWSHGWLDLFRGHEHRLAFDAIIHSVADIEALPFCPPDEHQAVAVRARSRNLLATIEFCKAHGIAPLRRRADELQSAATTSRPWRTCSTRRRRTTSPREYNNGEARDRLPQSPLPAPTPVAGIA